MNYTELIVNHNHDGFLLGVIGLMLMGWLKMGFSSWIIDDEWVEVSEFSSWMMDYRVGCMSGLESMTK